MAAMTRREFVKKSGTDLALAGILAAGATRLAAAPLGLPIGSQTYPHRTMIRDGDHRLSRPQDIAKILEAAEVFARVE